MTKVTIPLAQVHKFDVQEVGGKALPLGTLVTNHINVPKGFVILASVLSDIRTSDGLDKKIDSLLTELRDSKMKNVDSVSQSLRKVLEELKIPHHIESAISAAFQELNTDYVAVRSSASCEDQENHSWAGEFDTYTFVNAGGLMQHIKKCWASLYTSRALMYANKHNLPFANDMAVLVQQMINSDVSGVCFTKDPSSDDSNLIVIEAIWGLGELLVHGDVTPDRYWIDKKKGIILDIEVGSQNKNLNSYKGEKLQKNIIRKEQKNQKLTGEAIMTVAKTASKIEKIMQASQDIEWSFFGKHLYIFQTRPITGSNPS
ncbi:MAG: PEP/pyruvate-binding domain-containing protein [Candidatus Andersenbacteria bacterium]|nr:PEP/pyruvate-binding domain-containing protein [Candidatus Andersenbacteria bacterium]